MNKVRVEVFYQDNALQSIRIDHYEMEGLVAIENKTIPEWFMPASGRASWKGLKEELESQSRKEGELCFIFNGPEEEKAIFQKCIQENKLGRMADELEIEEAALEYLEIAQHCWQHGDDEGTLRAYEIAAKWITWLRRNLCWEITAREFWVITKMLCSGSEKRQSKAIQMQSIAMENVWKMERLSQKAKRIQQ